MALSQPLLKYDEQFPLQIVRGVVQLAEFPQSAPSQQLTQ